jgi:hypothetical protein
MLIVTRVRTATALQIRSSVTGIDDPPTCYVVVTVAFEKALSFVGATASLTAEV